MINRENRFISQIITVICATCGEHIKIDNRYESDVFEFQIYKYEEFNGLQFNCPHCKQQYDIPCKINKFD